MIKESYVRFDTALMLKEAGFDVPCECYYSWFDGKPIKGYCDRKVNHNRDKSEYADISRPTQDLAAKWLREVHGTFVKMERVGSFDGKEFSFYWSYSIISVSTACLICISGGRYDCYEDALEAGIVKVLERIISETKE